MTETNEALARLRLPQFPRSNGYDPAWVVVNQMGPHPLWLLESLLEHMPIEPGMRVLDLGCGTALTSIFLAREFGARVWAADLWIDPTRNWERIREAGVADLVVPMRVEAHDLPFAAGFFDAIVSIDAYEYFGTDDLYLTWGLSWVLAPGGRIGMVTQGLRHEIDEAPGPSRSTGVPTSGRSTRPSGGIGIGSARALSTWRSRTLFRAAGICGTSGRRSSTKSARAGPPTPRRLLRKAGTTWHSLMTTPPG